MPRSTPKAMPTTEQELIQRAEQLAGQTFASLAEQANLIMPDDLTREKGWVGQLLEWHLGATAGSKPQPDFEHLGIELKTIPIGYSGRPLESTFVCVAPLTGVMGLTWQDSHVKHKLARVLWVPVEGERDIPLAQRRVGLPILWSPNSDQAQQLQLDWEEHMEWIALGKVEQINAKQGDVMQLRPKAANASVVTDAYNASGQPFKAQPKGFYLRTSFTEKLLRDAIQAKLLQ